MLCLVFECPSDTPGTISKNLGSAMLTVLVGPLLSHPELEIIIPCLMVSRENSEASLLCPARTFGVWVGVGGVSEGAVRSEVM